MCVVFAGGANELLELTSRIIWENVQHFVPATQPRRKLREIGAS
jgi:hypothetical protein